MDSRKKYLLWGALAFLALGGGAVLGIFMTRSLRAKNPGSIDDIGQDYGAPEGLVKPNPDDRLLTFTSPFYGVRALVSQIYSTIFKHGNNTISSFVHAWAPSSDNNDEAAYASFLSNHTGLGLYEPITTWNFTQIITPFALAVAKMETGSDINAVWGKMTVDSGIEAGLQHVGLA